MKEANRVNKDVVKQMNHEEYVNVLIEKKRIRHEMQRIQSKFHQIRTYNINNIYLSCLMAADTYLIMELKL